MSIISQALLANPFKSKDFKWNTSTIMKPNGRGNRVSDSCHVILLTTST